MKPSTRKIMIAALLIFSFNGWAQLPSWGMTENQYLQTDFSNKMADIGAQAYKQNWLLKITAPADWHNTIRNALTNTGERDVQMSFTDSLYKSIAISAVKGAKVAKISSSSNGNATVQKQVIIEKPEIDTEVEAPDFGDTDFNSNGKELLEGIGTMEITVPTANATSKEAVAEKTPTEPATPVKETPPPVTEPAVAAEPAPTPQAAVPAQEQAVIGSEEVLERNKEDLRKRHARTKRVEKTLSYSSIKRKDELFIKGSVVLVKRFINQGVVLFYWMKEPYDPAIHKLVEKGSGKYQKDPEAVAGDTPDEKKKVEVVEEVKPTNLDFIAVDTAADDQDDLRRTHVRNKRVGLSISVNQLKEDDVLYVKNQTVLVERPLTSSQSTYFWLVGETTISREVVRKGDNKFIIK